MSMSDVVVILLGLVGMYSLGIATGAFLMHWMLKK
jgi:hypothetical protein